MSQSKKLRERSKTSPKIEINARSVAAFDLDGTLLYCNSSLRFCFFLASRSALSLSDLLFCLVQYTRHRFFRLPLLTLHESVFRRLFKGKKVEALHVHVSDFLSQQIPHFYYLPALNTLKTLQKSGVRIMILSSSPRFIVEPIAHLLGVNEVLATDYRVDDAGALHSIDSLVDGEKKARFLHSLEGSFRMAFSDSLVDLAFLESADHATVVRGRGRLKKIARKRGWDFI